MTLGFDPVLVNFDRQRPDQPQGALLIGKDADNMGAALEPLVDPLKPVRAFEMFAVLSRQTVKGKGFLIIALISALVLLPSVESWFDIQLVVSRSQLLTHRRAYSQY